MPKYKVVSLGNVPGADGWMEVNDAHYTGHEVELADKSIESIMRALKDCGVMSSHVTRQSVYFDWESSGERDIYIRAKGKRHKGLWLWQLELQPETTGVSKA